MTLTKRLVKGSPLTAGEHDDNLDHCLDRANHTGAQAQSTVTNLVSDLAAKAPLASPALTGAPTAPTATPGTNTTQIATTAFIQAAIAALLNSAPGALDTLDELAAALGDDANFAATMTAALALKAPLASPALTGTPTAPTAAGGTNTAQIATTAFVQAAVGAGIISSGAGAPSSTPSAVGHIYVDTTNDVIYMATDTVSSADWTEVLISTSGASLSPKTDFVDADDFLIFDSEASDAPKLLPGVEIARRTLDINAQTGTTYALVLTDAGKKVTMSNAGANTLTIPTNASVAFPVGTIIGVTMLGAGVTTVDGATGVTVNGVSGGGAAISAQYTGVTLTKLATDTWLMEGNHGTVS